MPIDLLVSMAASIIIATVKNRQHKDALRSVMLKIFKTIKDVYTGDHDFS